MLWLSKFSKILDYIFPKECFVCKKEGEYFCSACFNKVEYINNFDCYLCGRKDQINGICTDCASRSGIDQIIIATKYTGNFVGDLVESLKYNYVEDLAKIIAKILTKQVKNKDLASIFQDQILVPIPLHKKRFAERGFNQAEKIANYLKEKYNCDLKTDLLLRKKYTAQQAKLNRKERLENMQNAFAVNLAAVIPKHVILFDDVLTTGATMIQATKTFKKAGVEKVVCVAVCHG